MFNPLIYISLISFSLTFSVALISNHNSYPSARRVSPLNDADNFNADALRSLGSSGHPDGDSFLRLFHPAFPLQVLNPLRYLHFPLLY